MNSITSFARKFRVLWIVTSGLLGTTMLSPMAFSDEQLREKTPLSSPAVEADKPLFVDGPGKGVGRMIDARSMGFVCDGKIDNASVLDAIRAKAMAMSGQTVFFRKAVLPCLSSRPLLAVSGTTYEAEDTVTLKPIPGGAANPALFLASQVSDVTVRGFCFDGASATTGTDNNVIVVYRSAKIVFDHVTVQHAAGIGIVFSTGVSESGVRNSRFSDVGNGWKKTGLAQNQRQGVAFCCGAQNTNNYVVSSIFEDIGLDAISFSGQRNFFVSGNHFSNVGGAVGGGMGIGLSPGLTAHHLAGGAAIYGAVSNRVSVTNNVTDGAGGNGLDLYKVNDAEITGNTARRSGGNGIAFAAGARARITCNVVIDNNQARSNAISAPQAGIFLTGGLHGDAAVRRVIISGNIVTDYQAAKTQNYGIQLQNESSASDIRVDQSNQLAGNGIAAFGEGLSGYQPQKAIPANEICAPRPFGRKM